MLALKNEMNHFKAHYTYLKPPVDKVKGIVAFCRDLDTRRLILSCPSMDYRLRVTKWLD